MWDKPLSALFNPIMELQELGVDFFSASGEGIKRVYQHGLQKGKNFIELYNSSGSDLVE